MRVLFGEISIGIGFNVEVTHLVDLFNHMHNLEDAEIGLKLNRGIVIRYNTCGICVTHPKPDSRLINVLKDLCNPRFLIIIVSDLPANPLLAQAK